MSSNGISWAVCKSAPCSRHHTLACPDLPAVNILNVVAATENANKPEMSLRLAGSPLFSVEYKLTHRGQHRAGGWSGRVHSVLEKSLKMLEFGIKTSRPLKVLENR